MRGGTHEHLFSDSSVPQARGSRPVDSLEDTSVGRDAKLSRRRGSTVSSRTRSGRSHTRSSPSTFVAIRERNLGFATDSTRRGIDRGPTGVPFARWFLPPARLDSPTPSQPPCGRRDLWTGIRRDGGGRRSGTSGRSTARYPGPRSTPRSPPRRAVAIHVEGRADRPRHGPRGRASTAPFGATLRRRATPSRKRSGTNPAGETGGRRGSFAIDAGWPPQPRQRSAGTVSTGRGWENLPLERAARWVRHRE